MVECQLYKDTWIFISCNQLDVLYKILIPQNLPATPINHKSYGELLSDVMSCTLNPNDAEVIPNDTSIGFPLVPMLPPLHRVLLYI